MTRILLIAIFVGCSWGWNCVNNLNETHVWPTNCNANSFKRLMRNFELEKIVEVRAAVRNNEFPTIDAVMFQNMDNLYELRLGRCYIENVAEEAFSGLRLLSILDLGSNFIKKLNDGILSDLENLDSLYLYSNQIEEIPANLFEKNQKLKELQLDENKIKTLPDGLLDPLTELEGLTIRNNELEVIHQHTFQKNKNLNRLFLESNKITAIAGGAFDGLLKLVFLRLDNNLCNGKGRGYKTIIDSRMTSSLAVCASNYDRMFNEETGARDE
jgi:Leucine-rich repeat (LRR) protein